MIQLNLLPDVKLEFIKARRDKRLVMVIAVLVIGVSAGIFIMMFSFVGAQKIHMGNLDKDIDKDIAQIQGTPEIDKILTIQNQLGSLTGLHDGKPAVTRVLPYVAQLLPAGSTITTIGVDVNAGTVSITGKTQNGTQINTFVDTLKFAEYKAKSGASGKPFSEVVLSGFGVGDDSGDKDGGSSFTVSMKFDQIILDNNEEVEIQVPGIVSTRSSTEKPNITFEKTQTEENGQ